MVQKWRLTPDTFHTYIAFTIPFILNLLLALVKGPVQLAVPTSLAEISHVFVVVAHGFFMLPSSPKRSQ